MTSLPRTQSLGLTMNAAANNAAHRSVLSNVNLGSSRSYGALGGRYSEQETSGMHQWLPQTRVMFDSDAYPSNGNDKNWVAPPFNANTGTYDYRGYTLYDNLKLIRRQIANLQNSAITGDAAVTVESISNLDGTLTISPTQGVVIASLNPSKINSWQVVQDFAAGLSGTTGTFSGAVSATSGTFSGALSGSSLQTSSGYLYLRDSATGFFSDGSGTIKTLPNNVLQSSNFSSGVAGWQATSEGDFEIHNLTARGAFTSAVIHYNQVQSFAGSLLVAKSAGKLRSAVSIAHVGAGQWMGMLGVTTAGSAPIDGTAGSPYGLSLGITHPGLQETYFLDIEDPEGTSHAASARFAYNDVLRLKDGGNETWLLVKVVLDMTTYWRYQCVYKSGTTAATYPKGHGVVDYGTSDGTRVGMLYMTADDADAPFYSIRTHTGNPDTAQTEVGRFGMMRNAFGVTGAYFGFGVGDYSGGNYLKYDTNGGFIVTSGNGNVSITSTGMQIVAKSGSSTPDPQNKIGWTTSGNEIMLIGAGIPTGINYGTLKVYGSQNAELDIIANVTNSAKAATLLLKSDDSGASAGATWFSITKNGVLLNYSGAGVPSLTIDNGGTNGLLDVYGTGVVRGKASTATLVMGTGADVNLLGSIEWKNARNVVPFGMGMGGSTINGVRDDVFYMGWNSNPVTGGNIYSSSEAYYAHTIEGHYYNGVSNFFEWNHSYTSAGSAPYTVRTLEFALSKSSTSTANAEHSYRFRIGNTGNSFFQVGNPYIRDDLFSFEPDGTFKFNYAASRGAYMKSYKSGSDTVIRWDFLTPEGTPYFEIAYGLGFQGRNPSSSYDISAVNIKSDNFIASNVVGAGTGTSGFLMQDSFNYGTYAPGQAGLSGTPIRQRQDFGGVPYYCLWYPTAA